MQQLFFGDSAGWFTVPALIGTAVFGLKLLMSLVGDVAGNLDIDIDADHTDPDTAFKFLSIQSIAAFLMGFGWVGLAAYHGSDWGWVTSAVLGVAGGAAMVWLLGILLKAVYDLQSSGNVTIRDAVGREGDVYVTVPGGSSGRGQVKVTIGNRQRIFGAVTEGEELPSATRVRVLKANEDNTLTVTRA